MKRLKPTPRRHQSGLHLVEFAATSAVFFLVMFAAVEVARLLFTWSALDAMTQRGARVAAVCPLNDGTIAQTAIFDKGDGRSLIPDMGTENIGIRYLTADGNATTNIENVSYVEVSIQDYSHQMLIPETIAGFVAPLVTAPPFTTTRPAESLGRNPGGDPFC